MPHDDRFGSFDDTTLRQKTVARYARDNADRLDDEIVERLAAGANGTREAAFFDLDKTVIARSSTLVMSRPLWRDGMIAPSTVLRSLYAQFLYQLIGADHERMESMRHALLEVSTGWEADRIRRIVTDTLDDVIAPLVYAEALELFDRHREAGRDIWLVSSSGEEVVEPIADHLGINNVIATRSGLDDEGRYDGTIAFYAYGIAKRNALEQVAQARGYDLRDCWAYSDSVTDLPMLGAVGTAVAVNPDRELRAAAIAMGWPVEDFSNPVSIRRRLSTLPPKPSKSSAGAMIVGGLATYGAWRLLRTLLGTDES